MSETAQQQAAEDSVNWIDAWSMSFERIKLHEALNLVAGDSKMALTTLSSLMCKKHRKNLCRQVAAAWAQVTGCDADVFPYSVDAVVREFTLLPTVREHLRNEEAWHAARVELPECPSVPDFVEVFLTDAVKVERNAENADKLTITFGTVTPSRRPLFRLVVTTEMAKRLSERIVNVPECNSLTKPAA